MAKERLPIMKRFLLGVLIIIALGAFSAASLSEKVFHQYANEVIRAELNAFAGVISSQFLQYQTEVTALAAQQLKAGTWDNTTLQNILSTQLPNVVRVSIIPNPPSSTVATRTTGFAAEEQITLAYQKGYAAPELQKIGAVSVISWALKVEGIGVILIQQDAKLLATWFNAVPLLRIRQVIQGNSQVVLQKGNVTEPVVAHVMPLNQWVIEAPEAIWPVLEGWFSLLPSVLGGVFIAVWGWISLQGRGASPAIDKITSKEVAPLHKARAVPPPNLTMGVSVSTPEPTASPIAPPPPAAPTAIFLAKHMDVAEVAPPWDKRTVRSLFRAYDIRGNTTLLTPTVMRAIGNAIGIMAKQKKITHIAVGRDARLSSAALSEALIAGLNTEGITVLECGEVTSPMLYFAALERANGSGVVVTGSHNPSEENGLKMMLAGHTLCGADIEALYEGLKEPAVTEVPVLKESLDIAPLYFERLKNDILLSRPLFVVVDAGNGVAGPALVKALQTAGCKVEALYCEPDGNFPNHHPDPSQAENLRDLQKTVLEKRADLGIAVDGDGDRIGVIDNAGGIVWPDQIMMLLVEEILALNPGADILFDVKCSRNVQRLVQQYGGRPILGRTGHSYMKEKIRETGAVFAGEQSGHLYFPDRFLPIDDATYAACRVCEWLSHQTLSLAELVKTLPKSVATPELTIAVPSGNAHAMVEKIIGFDFPEAEKVLVDGLRLEYDFGWALVRASNTTPSIILRFEADTEAQVETLQQQMKAAFKALVPELVLPF